MTIRLLVGDCRLTLPTLEAGSVQAVVTSPPYWGLRSYGTEPLVWGGDTSHAHEWGAEGTRGGGAGHTTYGTSDVRWQNPVRNGEVVLEMGIVSQGAFCPCGAWLGSLGLEPTPDLYIDHIVECFCHVRRVLADDGVLWLNMGSSYWGSGRGPTGHNGIGDQAKRQGFVGGDGSDSSRSRWPQSVLAYGTDGREPPDFRVSDSACFDLCDECRAVLSNRTAGRLPHHPAGASLGERINRGSETLGSVVATPVASPHAGLESTNPESSVRLQDACSHCANCGACLSVLGSSVRDAQLCVRKTVCIDDIAQMCAPSAGRTSDTGPSSMARGYSTSAHLYKPKDEILMPFRVAMALQQDGWWLRSVIPWLKRNSMPESVSDRPSTSVEYVFLLAKSRTYYFDADAVRVRNGRESTPEEYAAVKASGTWQSTPIDQGYGQSGKSVYPALTHPNGRNRRNGDWFFESWQGLLLDEQDQPLALMVNPQPFTGAHYATFPPKLVEPMVKASTRPGDIVLDPFAGAGTVGLVADRLGRNAVLCELSDSYSQMARERIVGDAPLFGDVEVA